MNKAKISSCYDLSKQKQKVCFRIFDEKAASVFDHFSNELSKKVKFDALTLPSLTLLTVTLFIVVSAGVNLFKLNHDGKIIHKTHKDS